MILSENILRVFFWGSPKYGYTKIFFSHSVTIAVFRDSTNMWENREKLVLWWTFCYFQNYITLRRNGQNDPSDFCRNAPTPRKKLISKWFFTIRAYKSDFFQNHSALMDLLCIKLSLPYGLFWSVMLFIIPISHNKKLENTPQLCYVSFFKLFLQPIGNFYLQFYMFLLCSHAYLFTVFEIKKAMRKM